MKKLLLSIIAIAAFGFGANAQVKGQLDVLKELGEGTEFKAYWSITKEDDGKYIGEPYKAIRVLKFAKNMHGKLSGFSMFDKETGKTIINRSFMYLEPNHYTEPSVFHSTDTRKVWLCIDGLFYMLEKVKDPNNISNIIIEYILVPEVAKDTEDTAEKKKLTLKEKVAAAKAKLAESSVGIPKEIADRDHIAIIKKYLADMKPIQEKATASFSTEIKKEIQEINEADEAFTQKLQDQNKAYAAKLNAQKKKNGDKGSSYVVKNVSSASIKIMTGSGSTTTLNAGSTTTYLCTADVYYCVGQSTKGTLITVGEDACGKTISIK